MHSVPVIQSVTTVDRAEQDPRAHERALREKQSARTVAGTLSCPDSHIHAESMYFAIVLTLVVLAIATYTVQRTSRNAEKPGRWSRNGLLGIGTLSTLVMAGTIAGGKGELGYAMLIAWLPGVFAGILIERITYRPVEK